MILVLLYVQVILLYQIREFQFHSHLIMQISLDHIHNLLILVIMHIIRVNIS